MKYLCSARANIAATLACVVLTGGCSAPVPAEAPVVAIAAPPKGAPVHFAFETLDGKPLTTQTIAGRITVIGFVATYDTASQAQARFLSSLSRRHAPRLNVAILVLEPPQNRPMVEAFAATLQLPYPVALADQATIAGEGPFAGLHHVPSVVILDREGRPRWQHIGLIQESDIEEAVRAIEGRLGDATAREKDGGGAQ